MNPRMSKEREQEIRKDRDGDCPVGCSCPRNLLLNELDAVREELLACQRELDLTKVKMSLVQAEATVMREVLLGIAMKVPHLVSREEAADMACEFKTAAVAAAICSPKAGSLARRIAAMERVVEAARTITWEKIVNERNSSWYVSGVDKLKLLTAIDALEKKES